MKKRFLAIFAASLLCAFGCDPDNFIKEHARWFVMNLTDEDITVDLSSWLTPYKVSLSPGESELVYSVDQSNAPEVAKMEDLFDYATKPNWFFSVIKDGKVVRKWSATDLDSEGHQFPKAECWKKNIIADGSTVDWTFYIFPEDLVQQEQPESGEK